MNEKTADKITFNVNIREMREDDTDGVLCIDRKITLQYRALTYTSIPNSFLSGQLDLSVVAEIEGRIVGFLLGQMVTPTYQDTDIALVQNMGIDPDYLHQGIGTKLMQVFMELCKKRGADSIHVMVSVHDEWILSFLRSMNFTHGEIVELVKPLC